MVATWRAGLVEVSSLWLWRSGDGCGEAERNNISSISAGLIAQPAALKSGVSFWEECLRYRVSNESGFDGNDFVTGRFCSSFPASAAPDSGVLALSVDLSASAESCSGGNALVIRRRCPALDVVSPSNNRTPSPPGGS